MLPGIELASCTELAVPWDVMDHIVRVESSYNRYAIGVVGGHLVRQPRTLDEALSTVRMLEDRGFNFSVGLAQVNRYNLDKYGLKSYEHAFSSCPNLRAGTRILADCHRRHQDWGRSFSCYYSGNPRTGYRHGYVQKVFASIARVRQGLVADTSIAVVSREKRKRVAVEHFPQRGVRATGGLQRATPLNPVHQSASDRADVSYRADASATAPDTDATRATDSRAPFTPGSSQTRSVTSGSAPTVATQMPLGDGAVHLEPRPPDPSPIRVPAVSRTDQSGHKGDDSFVF